MLKILCAADVHIGRRSSRLPAGCDHSAADAWLALVDHAVQQRVDAVLIAGDLIDEQSRFFEASGPIERGVRTLRDAGIPVVAVSGNHDYDVLHRIAGDVGHDHLVVLGRGGRWERWTLHDADGRAMLHVDGWSFSSPRCPDNPLQSYTLAAPGDGAPVVGLLHCDLDGAEAHYAPVPAAGLDALPHAAWILGHIHAPTLRQTPGSTPSLYPGSLLALDPGETGVHGAWLLEVAARERPGFTLIPLSPVRYDTVTVALDGVTGEGSVGSRILAAAVEALQNAVVESAGQLKMLCCRLRVTGRTPLHGRMASIVETAVDLDVHREGARAVVDSRKVIDTAPALDLEDLARGNDAAARLSQILLSLDAGADLDADLVHTAGRAAAGVYNRSQYLSVDAAGPPRDADVRAILRRQAALLLDSMMSQKESA
jgi:DNA repair protein SbcD/Mre11